MISDVIVKGLCEEFNAIPPIEELEKMYSFSERHIRLMEHIFAELRRRERMENYWYNVRKIAVIIIAILAIAFVSVKFVPEVYAYVREWLMEFKEDRVRFEGNRSGERVEDVADLRFELGYVPEGYELESEKSKKTGTHIVCYKHYNGTILSLEYRGKADGNLVALNSEDVLIEENNINGIVYYVFECEGRENIVAWEKGEYLFKLKGLLEKTQLLDIAVSVKVVEK